MSGFLQRTAPVWAGLLVTGLALAANDKDVLFKTNFENGKKAGWKMTDCDAWKIVETDKGKSLGLVKQSDYKPTVRSPVNYALIEDVTAGDFKLDVKVKSTTPNYAHRDLCLFFGYKDPEHFYYVHLGKNADPHAHSIFLVNGSPRVSIAKERTKGTPWTDDWHDVRIVRNAKTGDIFVYFDDMKKPIMHAVDKTFPSGKIGLGSFDDTGIFDELVIRGSK